MKEYRLKITTRALTDMEQLYNYIAGHLNAPETAAKQYDRIADAIESLRVFPERIKLMDSKPEQALGMRRLLADNYSVIFVVGDEQVTVLRVLYSSSDIISRLRE